MMPMDVFPNFLYIGPGKAGSSWIFEILRTHPEVFVPAAKDLQFFDRYYANGFDWYLSFFREGQGKKAIGELSHNYFLAEEYAERIKKHLPDVRLFCCLRDPVERLFSAYLFVKTTHLNEQISFEEFAHEKDMLKRGEYYENLCPFYEHFPREHILILFFDDLKKHPQQFAQQIYQFLQINSAFSPPVLQQKILPASAPRWYPAAHLTYILAVWLRRLGFPNLVGRVKRLSFLHTLLYKPLAEKPVISPEIKYDLTIYYRECLKDLPDLIGQPLPKGWLQDL